MANNAVVADTGEARVLGATSVAVRGTRRRSQMDWSYAIFLVPGLLLFAALVVLPFIANVYVSFTRWTGVGTPLWIGLANYTKAFGDANFWASFRNNLYLIIGMTIIPTIIGLFLAATLFDYVAKRFGNTVANFFRAGFYLPQIIPVVVAAIVWGWILQPNWGAINETLRSIGLGALAGNWLGDSKTALPAVMLMLVWFQIGYPLVIFMAGMQRIDPEVYEAASIDGATWLPRFWRLTVPLIRPEIYVVVLTTTIAALKTFGPIYALTRGGPGSATTTASWFSYKNFFENANVGYGATMSTVLTLIVMVITIVYIRIQTSQEEMETG